MDTSVPSPAIEDVRASLHATANDQHLANLRARRRELVEAHAAALRGTAGRWGRRIHHNPTQALALACERDAEAAVANAHWLPQIEAVNEAIGRRMNSDPKAMP